MPLIDFLTLTAGAVLMVLAATIAAFRLIDAAEHTRPSTRGRAHAAGYLERSDD
jgi:hypothetical protein